MTKYVRSFKVWFGFFFFLKIILKTAQLFRKHFPSGFSLSLFVYFISVFIKARILLQFLSQAFSILYVFPIFFRFHYFINNNFCLSKNILANKFCTETCLYLHDTKAKVGFSLKENNLTRLKANRFLFIVTDSYTKICEIISRVIKNERSYLCDWR